MKIKKKYKLLYTSGFTKDFKKLSSEIQEKLIINCKKILKNPYQDIKKLTNIKLGKFRKRIGNYRLRFDIFENDIVLYSIKHRKDM